MMTIINEILKKLPFNGGKTIIGLVSSIALYFLPDFPIAELQKVLEYLSGAYLALGLLHKYIKAKI